MKLPELELHEPWIKPAVEPWAGKPDGLRVCWTDEWAELKMGVLAALLHASGPGIPEQVDLLCRPGARVATEWSLPGCGATESGFDDASAALCEAEVVLACNSALWVLAAGLGRPVVLMEPNPQRHHPVFLPQEWAHCLVRGADGQPTFDARAVVAAVREAVARPLLWGAVMRGSA